MAWAAEVGGACEAKADEREQGGDRVDDQDGGQTVPGRRGEAEVAVGAAAAVGREEAIGAVAQPWAQTGAIVVAVAKHAEVVLLVAA